VYKRSKRRARNEGQDGRATRDMNHKWAASFRPQCTSSASILGHPSIPMEGVVLHAMQAGPITIRHECGDCPAPFSITFSAIVRMLVRHRIGVMGLTLSHATQPASLTRWGYVLGEESVGRKLDLKSDCATNKAPEAAFPVVNFRASSGGSTHRRVRRLV